MSTFLTYTIIGVVVSCIYALSATGLAVTYTTSGVFNFAHGAIGMIAAFAYWQLTRSWGWPEFLAAVFVVVVAAPIFGAVVERTMMRRLEGASLEVQLATTLGLLVFLLGVANWLWSPAKATRTLPRLFLGHHFKLFSVFVDYHEVIVVAAAIGVAVGLRLFFARTRTGIAMRAVVDNSDLVEMAGGRPARTAGLSWMLGAALAALAGVLLAPLQTLDINILTLLIINAFAAAIVGRLKSLPGTIAGAFIIGLSITYVVGYAPGTGFLASIQQAIPMIVLFVVLIVMPQERLRTAPLSNLRIPRAPSLRQSLAAAGVFVATAAVAAA